MSLTLPRLAWFSPVSRESETNSAYFSRKVLPTLLKDFEIEIFSHAPESLAGMEAKPYLSAKSRHNENPFSLFVYNLEDTKELAFSRMHLALAPGLVIFHDLFLSDFGPEPILNSPWIETLKHFQDNEVPWRELDCEHDQRGPLAYREASYSLARIFTSPRDHREFICSVKDSVVNPEKETYFIPYPVSEIERHQAGKSAVFRVCYAGKPRMEDRPHKLLSALANTSVNTELTWLVSKSERARAEEMIDDYSRIKVRFVEGHTPENWQRVVCDADLAFHTRFSGYGQLGPFFSISCAAGCPVCITDFGGSDWLPDTLFFKITPGESEELQIARLVENLAQKDTAQLRVQILNFAAEFYDLPAVSLELTKVLQQAILSSREITRKWSALSVNARSKLLQTAKSHLMQPELLDESFSDLGWRVS